jgi:hypothetical protein
MKRYSTSLAIKEMQIKTTLISTEWLSSRKQTTNVDKDVGKKEPTFTVEMYISPATMEVSIKVHLKAKKDL